MSLCALYGFKKAATNSRIQLVWATVSLLLHEKLQ